MDQQPHILSVSQLNRQIRSWLEQDIGHLYVEGEVSTLSKPGSGHYYFTLKDANAQVRCVFFRNRHTPDTPNMLQAGQQIVAFGQLSLYEARGDYQLIVERVESAGQGDLFRQFELLKTKLAALGLFEVGRKRAIPLFPKTIGIITSFSAAALRDILTTLERRYPLADVIVYQSDVQGSQAPKQLVSAILRANTDNRCDVLILARGGGSIEDLWAFNDEQLAHAIAQSAITIVSGVGHETDFTIADFVADLRAATPTAAAEAVSPNQIELMALLDTLQSRLKHAVSRLLNHKRLLLHHELQKISSPEHLIRSHWQTLDYGRSQLLSHINTIMAHQRHHLDILSIRLNALNPITRICDRQQKIQHIEGTLIQLMTLQVQRLKQHFKTLLATLHAVSPLATLDRGYAIATIGNHVISNSNDANPGDELSVRLSHGHLICEVIRRA